jgi:hypothetical protein
LGFDQPTIANRGGLEGQNVAINSCPPTKDYPLLRLADRLFSLNDTSQEDDPAGQNCTLRSRLAQNKTPRTRFEPQGAQSISPPQVLLSHRIEPELFPVNGTAVPEGITIRPFSTNFHGYRFGGAGGWALQRVVTRLNFTGLWLAASPTRTDERLRLFHVAAHDSLGVPLLSVRLHSWLSNAALISFSASFCERLPDLN